MIRNAVGSLLALLGAAAAVRSPFRPWYDGRHGRDFRIGQLFDAKGVTGDGASLLNGLFLPMFVAVVVTLLGLLNQSRLLVFLAAVLVLGFTILWTVRQTQAEGSLTAGGDGLDVGAGLGFAAGVLLLAAATVMRGRRARVRRVARKAHSMLRRLTERYADGLFREDRAYGQEGPYGEGLPYGQQAYEARPYGTQAYGQQPYSYGYGAYAPQADATVRPFPEPPREAPYQAPYEDDWRNAA